MTYEAEFTRKTLATLYVHETGACARTAEPEDMEMFGLVPVKRFEEITKRFDALQARYNATASELDAANNRVAELERQLASRTGPYCAHCGGQHLGVDCRMRAAEQERDDALARARRAAQILVDEFGSDGPLYVDEAAELAVRVARQRADGLAQAVTDATAEVVDRVCAAVRVVGGTLVVGDRYFVGFGYVTDKHAECIRDEIRKAAKS